MTKDEALAFHGEMEVLLARGPGGIDDEARHQLQRIRFACHPAPDGHGYLREKAIGACAFLEIWLNPQKGTRWGQGPTHLRHIVFTTIHEFGSAIDRAFREPTGGTHGPTQ
jgi:hypothetical protein